jgi:BlaI family penicillinase repressor
MVPKHEIPRPTDAELAILRVLWRLGPSTVRQVQHVLDAKKPTGYTTVLKLMQIMTEKGLLDRDESRRTHVYRPRRPAEKTQQQLVGDLLERAFGGSAQRLVMQALSTKRVTPEELEQIRELLDTIEGREP